MRDAVLEWGRQGSVVCVVRGVRSEGTNKAEYKDACGYVTRKTRGRYRGASVCVGGG